MCSSIHQSLQTYRRGLHRAIMPMRPMLLLALASPTAAVAAPPLTGLVQRGFGATAAVMRTLARAGGQEAQRGRQLGLESLCGSHEAFVATFTSTLQSSLYSSGTARLSDAAIGELAQSAASCICSSDFSLVEPEYMQVWARIATEQPLDAALVRRTLIKLMSRRGLCSTSCRAFQVAYLNALGGAQLNFPQAGSMGQMIPQWTSWPAEMSAPPEKLHSMLSAGVDCMCGADWSSIPTSLVESLLRLNPTGSAGTPTDEIIQELDMEEKMYAFLLSPGFLCGDTCRSFVAAFLDVALANAQGFASFVGAKFAAAVIPAADFNFPPLVNDQEREHLVSGSWKCVCHEMNFNSMFAILKDAVPKLAAPEATLGDAYTLFRNYVVFSYSSEGGSCSANCLATNNAELGMVARMLNLLPLGYLAGVFEGGVGVSAAAAATDRSHLQVRLGTRPTLPNVNPVALATTANDALVAAAHAAGSCMCDLDIGELMDKTVGTDGFKESCGAMPFVCASCAQYAVCSSAACAGSRDCNDVDCLQPGDCAACAPYAGCNPFAGVKPSTVYTVAKRVVNEYACSSAHCRATFEKLYAAVDASLVTHPTCSVEVLSECERCMVCMDGSAVDSLGEACTQHCARECLGDIGASPTYADEGLFWGACVLSKSCPASDGAPLLLEWSLRVSGGKSTATIASAVAAYCKISTADVQVVAHPPDRYTVYITTRSPVDQKVVQGALQQLDATSATKAFLFRVDHVEGNATVVASASAAPQQEAVEPDSSLGGGTIFLILLLVAGVGTALFLAGRRYAKSSPTVARALGGAAGQGINQVAPSHVFVEQGMSSSYTAPQLTSTTCGSLSSVPLPSTQPPGRM
ncbi:hypothetical protein AB1Y20_019323 [Prymnesium parvum]|uniref:Uncharacterized protein n=1 Tax=Prymnesium parvum TaxID=97485 RepID=A0AB34JTN7_PRYPA